MTDPVNRPAEATEAPPATDASPASDAIRTMAMIVWAAHLAGLVTGGIGSLVAVILAYLKCADARGTVYQGHLHQAIRAFWISLGVAILAVALTAATKGILGITLLVPVIYILNKGIKGILRAKDRRDYA